MRSQKKTRPNSVRRPVVATALAVSMLSHFQAIANPSGGKAVQGSATFNTSGSQLTINTSAFAQINWSSFNIAAGETTTFKQPSSSSVVWNQINDPNASQILGNLNANGYVVLQNQNGFYIGGNAAISTHGLFMTTSAMPPPDLAGGGAWSFNAISPTASIINYGQISTVGGGPVFLIADDIENNGSISAPGGSVSLAAGANVSLSTRPDGKGLSTRVTLPAGSIDNEGQITADGGTIALNAQVVNQGGTIQANSVQNNNGVIELIASDTLNLKASSVITASGDSTATSEGGFVVLQSGNTFADTAGSAINVSGHGGGVEGFAEILGPNISDVSSINSTIDGLSAANFSSSKNRLLLNPDGITLSTSPTFAIASSPNIKVGDLSSFSKIALFSLSDITVETLWTLPITTDPNASVTLVAARNLTLNNGSSLSGGANWNLNLTAGTELTSAAGLVAGQDGIYLNGNAFVRAFDGNINAFAGNEIIIDDGIDDGLSVLGNGIRTIGGGSITATATYGDVNTGGNPAGYNFNDNAPPFYKVNNQVGGISTAAGGDVTITAGGNVTSYLPLSTDTSGNAQHDGGTGAFGPEAGNVTITAGGSVYGHYVLANGIGTITAENGDMGVAPPLIQDGFALSLIKGNWNLFAPNGTIYLQEIRNPNGVLNDAAGQGSVEDAGANTGYHYYDYDPDASLSMQAYGVEITGLGGPDTPLSSFSPIPLMFPPSLSVVTGHGGFVLDANVNLFPSAHGEVNITTTDKGNFESKQDPNDPADVNVWTLEMFGDVQYWDPGMNFFTLDTPPTDPEAGNPNPVKISVDGDMNNVNLVMTKQTSLTVGGNLFNSSLTAQNHSSSDITSITVGGKISYPEVYTSDTLGGQLLTYTGLNPGNPNFQQNQWYSVLFLMLDWTEATTLPDGSLGFAIPNTVNLSDPKSVEAYAESLRAFSDSEFAETQFANSFLGFNYDATTKTLVYQFQMPEQVRALLEGPNGSGLLPIIKVDPNTGVPLTQVIDGKTYFVTTDATFATPTDIAALGNTTLKNQNNLATGFSVSGPGALDISAASLDLGSSQGIFSGGPGAGAPASEANTGASIDVDVTGDISMLSSTIASIGGGDVTVTSGGKISLSLGQLSFVPLTAGTVAYGIFTSGHSDVHVTAAGDIDIGSSRIGAFNGGSVFVTSTGGNIDAGNGVNQVINVPIYYIDPTTGLLAEGNIGDGSLGDPRPYGSGILALSLPAKYQIPGFDAVPGNITATVLNGNIIASLGGVEQFALGGALNGSSSLITLTAHGTPPDGGNINLGAGGVIGENADITADGSIQGLVVTRGNANISAVQNVSATVLSGGTASVGAGGAIAGTIIGGAGVNASGADVSGVSILSANANVNGGASESTLGTTATATAAATSAAGTSSADSKEQLADNSNSSDDDEQKKNAKKPALARRGRVTVVLPKAI